MRVGEYYGYTLGGKLTPLVRIALQTHVRYWSQKIRTQEYTKTNHRATKSFHTSTYSWEHHDNPALHPERSHAAVDLGVFTLDTRFHDARVAENNDG